MDILVRVVAPLLVALHGLIHLFGTVVYLKIADIEGFPYKTTVLSGTWDLGETGIAVFGALWGLAALGFIISALGMFIDAPWSLPALGASTLLSLGLTGLDYPIASTGLVVNLTIAVILLLIRVRRGTIRELPSG